MKNFTQELKKIIKEDPGVPIMSPDELRARSQTIVILTNEAPKELLALAGPDRKATLLSIDPPMITLPYQKGVFKVRPEDIVFENHHTGRDVTEAGGEETPYEKFFSQAMKKFGVSSPIELSPDDTKKFFNYVDKNWEAEEETDVDEDAEGGMSMGQMASDLGGATSRGTASVLRRAKDDEDDEETTEDVSTGKVGKKDKGSYQHAYKLALKKYQIHSADELDTPAERKGFTDYVDRLWKKGDIHRDKKEASIDTDITEAPKSPAQRNRERIKKQKQQQAKQKQKKQAKASDERKRAADTARKAAVQKKQEPEKPATSPAKKDARDVAQDREKEQQAKEREREQQAREREREQDNIDRERERFEKLKKKVDDPDDDSTDAKDKDKKIKSGKSSGFMSKLSKGLDYDTKDKFFEGVKKTPGVSKKAKGAVGFAKHARKGTGAKRQFQKGVRQAGKKQARNEAAKVVPYTFWNKASDDKRAKLLQLAKPGISTKFTKVDYDGLTPMLQKAIDKVFKTKKVKLEVSPPDRKEQVKGIKKHMAQKKGKDKIPKTYVDKKTGKRKETNPWALAWAQYDKYGVPSRIEKD